MRHTTPLTHPGTTETLAATTRSRSRSRHSRKYTKSVGERWGAEVPLEPSRKRFTARDFHLRRSRVVRMYHKQRGGGVATVLVSLARQRTFQLEVLTVISREEMASLQGALHSPGHRAHCPTPCPALTTTSDSAGHPQSAETASESTLTDFSKYPTYRVTTVTRRS